MFYSGAVSEIKPEISSVYIYSDSDDLIFISTDSFRLAEKKIRLKKILDVPGIIIPLKNIPEIIRFFSDSEQEIKIDFNKNQISFTQDDIYITSRLIDGIFPDYKQIIPNETSTEVIVLKQDLLNALKLSNVFSDKFNHVILVVKQNKNISNDLNNKKIQKKDKSITKQAEKPKRL